MGFTYTVLYMCLTGRKGRPFSLTVFSQLSSCLSPPGLLLFPPPSRTHTHTHIYVYARVCVSYCSDVASGKVRFQLGKEAVPRHRLQALLARGEFERALELARATSMDETDVHAARLLALLREGSGAAATASTAATSLTSAGMCVHVCCVVCVCVCVVVGDDDGVTAAALVRVV